MPGFRTLRTNTEIEYVLVGGVTYRRLDEERILGWEGLRDTLRIQLVETTDAILPPITVLGDFDSIDFGSDFSVGA